MDRTQKRCLTASVMFHAALLGVFALATAFSRPAPLPSAVPVLELIPTDLILTDGQNIGGGSPKAHPPKANPPPALKETPPPKETPLPKTKPERPPEKDPSKPVAEKQARTKTPEPKAEPDKSAQDTDDTQPRRPSKPTVQISEKRSKRPSSEAPNQDATTERRDRETRDREIAAANNARQQLADSLQRSADSIAKGTGASTSITMPGPGGAAYAPYRSYLDSFYRARWRSPKASASSKASAKVSVEIARDGTVLNWDLLVPSGNRELDDSVRDLLKRYPKLRPLPDTTKDSKRLFTIQFRLDADTSL